MNDKKAKNVRGKDRKPRHRGRSRTINLRLNPEEALPLADLIKKVPALEKAREILVKELVQYLDR